MDNNIINYEKKWSSILLIIILVILTLFVIFILITDSNHKEEVDKYKTEINNLKLQNNEVIKNSEDKIKKEQFKFDSLSILLSATKQNIYIRNEYYNEKNKIIGGANDHFTDSLYRENLRSNYIKYRYLLN